MVSINSYLHTESPAHPLAFFFQVLSLLKIGQAMCIAIESKVGPMNHEHPLAFLKLVHVAIVAL